MNELFALTFTKMGRFLVVKVRNEDHGREDIKNENLAIEHSGVLTYDAHLLCGTLTWKPKWEGLSLAHLNYCGENERQFTFCSIVGATH